MSDSGPRNMSFDQCLFGYDDGHRLLASSVQLTPGVEHYLLEASDLDPGATNPEAGYWTGLPLTEMRAYALMRTWAAPEMPRPGCVWTHAILIKNADIASIPDLSIFWEYIKRPVKLSNFHEYFKKVSIEKVSIKPRRISVTMVDCVQAIESLYSSNPTRLLSGTKSVSEYLAFALWSQQWPRLRRAFKFRTSSALNHGNRERLTFDLRVGDTEQSRESIHIDPNQDSWARNAAVDLLKGEVTSLRRFLWRYGSDLVNGRSRYKFLVQLYSDATEAISIEDKFALLNKVADELPSPDDGSLLKKDLLSMGGSVYSMMPFIDPIHMISYLVNESGASAYPKLSSGIEDFIRTNWISRHAEILALAKQAYSNDHIYSDVIIREIADCADKEIFFEASNLDPDVRARAIFFRPDLLDTDLLSQLRGGDLISLLQQMPHDEDLVERVIRRILSIYDWDAAKFVQENYRNNLMRVMRRLLATSDANISIAPCWEYAAEISSASEFEFALEEAIGSSAEVAAIVRLSKWNYALGRQIPIETWSRVITFSADDVRGQFRIRFLSFLLTLALQANGKGRAAIFEYCFEEVHSALWHSMLPHSSFDPLSSCLPDLPFWQQWDSCLRLRLAVIHAYSAGDLDRSGLSRLSSQRELQEKLVNLAESRGARGSWFR